MLTNISHFEFKLQESCIETSNNTLKEHFNESKETGRIFDLSGAIKTTESIFKYIRYDYFRKKFVRYTGRMHGEIQDYNYGVDLHNIVAFYNEEDTGVFSDNRTGKEYLEQEWFPYSKVALRLEISTSGKAKQSLKRYLIDNQLVGVIFDRPKHDEIHKFISELTHLYDCRDIGIKKPYTGNFQLKPALEKLGYELIPRQHGLTYLIKPIEENNVDENL